MARLFLRIVSVGGGLVALLVVYTIGAYAPLFDGWAETTLERPFPEPPPGASRPARRALLVSIDGLAPRVMAVTPTPVLDRLVREGTSAAHAETVVPSITMTAHATMLTGVEPDVHRVRFNRYQPWRGIAAPTLFDHCAEAGLRCGLFAGKRKFFHFVRDSEGAARYAHGEDAAAVLAAAAGFYATADPDFTMVHLAEVDWAGHEFGWDSEEQRAALAELDAVLGPFLEEARAASPRPLVVLLTSDHGGHGTTHGSDRPEDVDIPWILHGPGIPPATTRPHATALQVAPTILSILTE
ncbi:MAG: alkaline phosphatase family protein [Myxococcota bacterium]|nr:alkaline phosphatase family protein [Myxococcota bacterium]